jgi:TRAP-type C4-dicarboxylate transport system substrate-binding protein
MPNARFPLTAAVVAAVLVQGGAAQAQTVLRFNRWVPPTHHTQTQMMAPWATDVAKATGGRVKVEFTQASLGPPPRQFDLAASGAADVAFGDHTYTPGRFLITHLVEFPFTGNSGEALSVAYWRTYSPLPQAAEEHRGTKLLAVFTHGPASIMTSKKPVTSIQDLSGMKIRVPGELTSRIVSLLGGVPVAAPTTQVFDMLSKGIVDGSVYNIDAYKNFRLDKYINNITTFDGGLYNISFFVVMNEGKWKALSEADRKAIMGVSGEAFARRAGRTWDAEDKATLELAKKNGAKVVRADAAFTRAVRQRTDDLREEWVLEVKQKRLDGAKLLSELQRQYKAYKPAP